MIAGLGERWWLPAGATAIAVVVLVPVLVVAVALAADRDHLGHLAATVLPGYIGTSLALVGLVAVGALALGTSTAWLVTACRFPGSRILAWALVLPFAVPAYLQAYAYADLLEFAGPVQSWLRWATGWTSGRDYWFPDIRSLPGAAVVLVLATYPYVYVLARSAFLTLAAAPLEAARTLGHGPWLALWRIVLPLARPALAAGTALVAMETLADYGTVDYLAVDTFTTGIYRAWGSGERTAAGQLAALLLVVVAVLLGSERLLRRGAHYHADRRVAPPTPYRLGRWAAGAALAWCLLPVMLGFVLPLVMFLALASDAGSRLPVRQLVALAGSSLALAAAAALLVTVAAVVVMAAERLVPGPWTRLQARLAGLGYALPGSVIAVGVLIPAAWLDHRVDDLAQGLFGISTGLFLSGTMAALLGAYLVRFLAVGLGAVEAGYARLPGSLDHAARLGGCGRLGVLARVHLPLLLPGLAAALLLAFVDVLKELPATMIVRPFGLETLAVRVHHLASDERLGEAALPALLIIAVGLLPVVLLTRVTRLGSHR